MTKRDRILACQIPQEELITMSTEELLDRCLNYPYLVDVYFVENISLYFPHIIKSFNGLIEFFNYRDDAGSVLLNMYRNIHPNIMETKSTNVEKGFTNFRFQCLSLFLAHDEIIKQLNGSEKTVISELLKKYDQMEIYNYVKGENVYNIYSKNFIGYALAKYLNNSCSIGFGILKNSNEEINKSISKFHIDILSELSINEIRNVAKEYIKN